MTQKDIGAKKKFLVRWNCEYSLQIEAYNEEEALQEAKEYYLRGWNQAWSEMKVEESTED